MEVTGSVRGTRSGLHFLIREDGGDDLLIAGDSLHGAVHGDRVRVVLFPRHDDFRPLAVVEEILERPHPHFTGDLVREGKHYHVRPDSPLLPERLAIRLGTVSPVAGAKVLFRLENKDGKHPTPYGILEEVLGEGQDARLDLWVLGHEFGLATRFSEEAEEEAAAAASDTAPSPEQKDEDTRRRDLRDHFVVTIDPIEAKDFDDAISIEPLAGGTDRVFVHVADVTYYVREGSVLDEEARARGTSVYFAGGVFPMLPESLSAGAASLSPETDKRTMTAVLDVDEDGAVHFVEVTRGWVRSRRRFAYEEVQEFLDAEGLSVKRSGSVDDDRTTRDSDSDSIASRDSGSTPRIDAAAAETLRKMHEVASRLRKRRFADGGFQLDLPEAKIHLGANGIPRRIDRRVQLEAHWIIEEFMIAANRGVGTWARKREIPFLFRIHEPPESDAIDRFAITAKTLMPRARMRDLLDIPFLRRWLAALPGQDPITWVVHRFFLRAMQKAVYSHRDVGHFGLGIDGYAHFTSPIRRYPDFFDHRRLKEAMDGREVADSAPDAATLARACSAAEGRAEDAEREMALLKTVRYLQQKEGKTYPGFVTALTHRGLYIELLTFPAEGFVPRANLPNGTEFVEERMAWIERRAKWELRPGDKVIVQVVLADVRKRRIEFRILETVRGPKSARLLPLHENEGRGRKPRGRGKGRGKGRDGERHGRRGSGTARGKGKRPGSSGGRNSAKAGRRGRKRPR